VHFAPALTAANAGREREEPRRVRDISKAKVFFIPKRVLIWIGFVSTP
jgi:hypothetical protein